MYPGSLAEFGELFFEVSEGSFQGLAMIRMSRRGEIVQDAST